MNVFDLYAKIALDTGDYENGLEDASEKTSSFADKLKTGLATAAKVGTAAIGAAAAGIAALTKSSIEGYAEYEQLVGGVETLFKASADVVQEYADNAYKTAGLSSNEYMNTVTSFSASLLQSLNGDTQAAAEYANTAITDMSDNANKMGTSMEMIQNAYQGFAKQNFTMLDNLKLGYGGTKEEMERLLADAEKISGIEYDISSYADIVDAIHVVQTEMGITGTTAKEASETIAGSIAAAKSAWKNLVVGVADDNADFEQLVNNFVESVGTAANNIIPRIEVALTGAGKLVETLVPVIVEKIPELIQNTLPTLLQSGINMVHTIFEGMVNNLPEILQGGIDLIFTLIDGIISAIPDLIEALPEIITAIIVTLAENFPKIIDSGMNLLGALITGILRSIPKLVTAIPQIITAIVNGFNQYMGRIRDIGKNIVQGVWEGIKSMASWISDKVSGFFGDIVDGAKDFLGIHSPSTVFAAIGQFMAEGLGEGWYEKFDLIRKGIEEQLNFNAVANVTASGANSARGAFSAINITVNVNGNASAQTGEEIGRQIANELRYRGVLNYA